VSIPEAKAGLADKMSIALSLQTTRWELKKELMRDVNLRLPNLNLQ